MMARVSLVLAIALVLVGSLPTSAQIEPTPAQVEPISEQMVEPSSSQLKTVRTRIRKLESELVTLQRRRSGTEAEQMRLNAELSLAEARVSELELVLTNSRNEAVAIKEEAKELGHQIEERRQVLTHHLEMLALLGQPGPLQLFFDAAQGGDLERAISTVAVLTSAQVQLMHEYRELKRQRTSRLATLSRVLEEAEQEAEELLRRRQSLRSVRTRVERELRRLRRDQRSASNELEDLRQREQALQRLLEVLATRDRMPDAEDIRRFRGALPWPVKGKVTQTFGKHALPKYSTYTVCNGLRLEVAEREPVYSIFPGEVAYASLFKGYGNMVVLDHGNSTYSLVAGLDTILVRLNQRVTMGLRLGMAAPPSEEGNIYLEIRVDNIPQDPHRWLQLQEGRL
jgi:septal ring factor EnvC (AmiA/AmiB activator)